MKNVILFVSGYLIGGVLVGTYFINYIYKKGVKNEKVVIDI